jgi:dethiobiotin synthetase
MKKFFVTGIGTDVGKTLVSAILVEALGADYWKPVQAGSLGNTDADTVRSLISNQKTVFHPEAYRLQMPASPHAAAAAEGLTIDPANITVPETENHLVIEGAGGVMVPLNPSFLVIDLLASWQIPTVMVSRNYLGSINHTLLTVEALQKRNVPIAGIVFNGDPNPATEEVILHYTQLRGLPSLRQEQALSREVIRGYADQFQAFLINE